MSTDHPPSDDEQPKSITFEYVASPFRRVIHADGAWGGVTVRGGVFMSLFSEHHRAPASLTYPITPEGQLGEPDGPLATGLVRECEIDVVMNEDGARALLAWLQDKLTKLDALKEVVAARTTGDE